jgi:3-hydroxyacyl-CoA dehydrogenase / enoyl-CoA hydratase / 3-hydroxybutyryl-CoA epimerase
MTNNKQSVFKLTLNELQIAEILLDVPGEKQNSLRGDFIDEINILLDDLEQHPVQGVVFASGKPDSFIVGADINMLDAIETEQEVRDLTTRGYTLFNRIRQFKVPVVSEIHGACLGAGLELALACHGRVCSSDSKTILALPEVQLGLLPGGGGTQRLPALIGIMNALDMMTTGKNIRPKKALKLGLVDRVVEQAHLRKASIDCINKLTKKRASDKPSGMGFNFKSLLSIQGWQSLALEKNDFGQNLLFEQARKKVLAKTHGNYPAPERIIDCVEAWAQQSPEKAYELEAEHFAELVLSPESKQLRNIFFAVTALKKDNFSDAEPKTIRRVGVLGGGLMGAGIAYVSANKTDADVRLRDVSDDGVNHALSYAWQRVNNSIKKRHISHTEGKQLMAKISATKDYSGFKSADMVIEAVFESLELKHQMVKEFEKQCPKRAIFASNTSSIPITDIAKAAKHPERVIGMHYFSPVEKMPLLEIIATKETADWVIASAVDFGRKQGKTVIVVNDGAGFYTSRILGAYMNEAGHMVADGVPVERIDKALVNLGYPIGPLTLLDEVGIDVGTKIAPVLEQAFGERMVPAKAFAKLLDTGRKGKKNKRGFYDYSSKSHKNVDQSVYADLGVTPNNLLDPLEIAERCNLMLVNEAIRCLEDGILNSERDGDIGAIFGLGFPAYLGGPFRFANELGINKLLERLNHYHQTVGDRFEPAKLLVKYAQQGKQFYS